MVDGADPADTHGVTSEATEVVVKYAMSGYESVVAVDRIRPMEATSSERMDGKGRRLRRSGRSSVIAPATSNANSLANANSSVSGVYDGAASHENHEANRTETAAYAAALVTPSPTEMDSASPNNSGSDVADDADEEEPRKDSKSALKDSNKRKRESRASASKKAPAKKAKTFSKAKSEDATPYGSDCDEGNESKAASKVPSKRSSKGNTRSTAKSGEKESPYFAKGFKKPQRKKGNDGEEKDFSRGGNVRGTRKGRKLILAPIDGENDEKSEGNGCHYGEVDDAEEREDSDEGTMTGATAAGSSEKKSNANTKGRKRSKSKEDDGKAETNGVKVTKGNKANARKSSSGSSGSSGNNIRSQNQENSSDDDDNNVQARAISGKPDGNGGLNQPSPFHVEYSKTGRANCRTCDEKIEKGDVRVGHTPLFRGKVRSFLGDYLFVSCIYFVKYLVNYLNCQLRVVYVSFFVGDTLLLWQNVVLLLTSSFHICLGAFESLDSWYTAICTAQSSRKIFSVLRMWTNTTFYRRKTT